MATDRNVFRPGLGESVSIGFRAPGDGRVSVKVYNLAGELLRPVFEAGVSAGTWFQASWDGKNAEGETVASGVYFISVKGAGLKSIRRVVLIK